MTPQRVVAATVAVVLAGWGVADALLVGWSSPAPVSVLVALLVGLPIAWLVTRPYVAAGVVTGVLVLHGLLWSQPEAPPESIALFLVAFGVGAYAARSFPLWLVLGAGVVVVQLRDAEDASLGGMLFLLGSWAIALAVGRAVSQRQRAEQEDRLAAASTRDAGPEVAAAALASERERIARDLHDVVTRSVTLMVEEAAVGRGAVPTAPRVAEAALVAVEEIGQQALSDLRRMLGLIRGGTGAPGPQPGLAAVPSLVEASGATLRAEGDLASVPDGPSVAAYRIVQEALAHAPSGAQVAVVRSARDVTLEVTSHRPAAAREGESGALTAMRRRAGMYGGTVEVRSTGGGCCVRAVLPCGPC